jgi:hypothetical protein
VAAVTAVAGVAGKPPLELESMSSDAIHLNSKELEEKIRLIVREEVSRRIRPTDRTLLDDWNQEGPEDAEGDVELLRSALAVLERHQDQVQAWMPWDTFEIELDRKEEAGELPD